MSLEINTGTPQVETKTHNSIDVLQAIKTISYEKERGKDASRVELHKHDEEQLTILIQDIKDRSARDEKTVVIVVRAYNKKEDAIQRLFHRLQNLHKDIPEIGGVLFSINKDADKENTADVVQSLAGKIKIPVASLNITGYTWTAGLNAPASLLHQLATGQQINEKNILFFPYSTDVEILDNSSEISQPSLTNRGRLQQAIKKDKPIITFREDSRVLSNIGDRKKVADASIKIFKDTQAGKKNWDEASLQTLVKDVVGLTRNTAMVYLLSDINQLGGFNKDMNKKGGMEDQEFFIRMFLEHLYKATGFSFQKTDTHQKSGFQEDSGLAIRWIIDVMKMLKNPIVYTDDAWIDLSKDNRLKKKNREVEAVIHGIILYFAQLIQKIKEGQVVNFTLETKQQDFRF